MSTGGRIRNFLAGIFMILGGIVMLLFPPLGYALVTLMLGLSLFFAGARKLVFYFTMARNMVGGKSQLFVGLILLDFGAFTLSLTEVPRLYIALYLLGAYLVSGAMDVARGVEGKRYASPTWKRDLRHGLERLALAALCLVFARSEDTLVLFYCIGLFASAAARIASAFRRTAIVYIQ